MPSAEETRDVVVNFWVAVDGADYDKVSALISENCTVHFPGWEKTYNGKNACAEFFKRFMVEKNVTETDLSFFQGYHPGGEDDGSHRQIVNWIREVGKSKQTGEDYTVTYTAKFEIQDGDKIGDVWIVMETQDITKVFGE